MCLHTSYEGQLYNQNRHVKLTFACQSEIVIHFFSVPSLPFRLPNNPFRKVQSIVKNALLFFRIHPLARAQGNQGSDVRCGAQEKGQPREKRSLLVAFRICTMLNQVDFEEKTEGYFWVI